MHQPTTRSVTATIGHFDDEADIGSGEKTAGERETEEMIKSVPALPPCTSRQHSPPAPAP
ncbi:hypothetical protein HSX11_01010 [Oxalobacteraceae bacterium]|nr:hypothetical protein [Oxalobacteraceae bacterium]